jgi:hypothetical protein
MTNYMLNLIDLGNVQSEEHSEFSDLYQTSYPLSTSKANTVEDYEGVKRIITIKGIYNSDMEATLWNWIATIDALQNGFQSTITYYSPKWDATTVGNYMDGNFQVKVARFVFTYLVNSVNSVEYTITLYEGLPGI